MCGGRIIVRLAAPSLHTVVARGSIPTASRVIRPGSAKYGQLSRRMDAGSPRLKFGFPQLVLARPPALHGDTGINEIGLLAIVELRRTVVLAGNACACVIQMPISPIARRWNRSSSRSPLYRLYSLTGAGGAAGVAA